MERGRINKEERYKEGQEIAKNAKKLNNSIEKARMLGREIQEMATHFRAFKAAMESLRIPRDNSVLKKLSNKQKP